MRVLARTTWCAATAAAMAMAVAVPAAAKGPTGVAIALPGEDPVELPVDGRADGAAVAALAEDLGVWETTGDGQGLLPDAPTTALGPALTVEWTMYDASPGRNDPAPRIVQTLYPQAWGGALVHTAGGQPFFADQATRAGWFRAPERVIATLAAVGVEGEIRLPEPAPDPGGTAAQPPLRPVADRSSAAWVLAAAAAPAIVAALVARRVIRRRRGAAIAGG